MLALLAVLGVAAAITFVALDGDDPEPSPIEGALGYDALDLVNPMRGQFDNIVTGLFPQSSPAQNALPDWPGSRDAAIRLTWRQLEPERGRYDFSLLDRALDTYEQRGMRVALRVSTYDSCCLQLDPGQRNLDVPDWVAETPGAVEEIDRDGVTQVIPRWNDDVYLAGFEDLLAELGRRYDTDERLSIWEMSGYGDFGENVVSLLRDQLGRPGPGPDESEAELGYFSQYEDQFITAESAERLVAANLRAFPRTQIVSAPANPFIMAQLLRDSPALEGVDHPVGVRSDCLGVLDVLPAWASSSASRYVERDDPLVDLITQRLREAPVLTEWCQVGDLDPADYYRAGLDAVIERHVSMTSSSGFPDQLGDTAMDPDLYEVWRRANVYAGYRYATTAVARRDGDAVDVEATWSNLGVASTHEQWRVVYRLVDGSGAVVAEQQSDLDLRELVADQDSSEGVPTPATVRDEVALGSIAEGALGPGEYVVTATVEWDQHKRDATHRVDYPPMELALDGRSADGAYRIGTLRVG